jgi:hypothetical protein
MTLQTLFTSYWSSLGLQFFSGSLEIFKKLKTTIMKTKIIGVCTLFIAFTSNINAQDTDQREKFALGVKAGLNLSNVWDSKDNEFRADSKAGFAGGLFIGIPINRYIGLQPEILISQKGFKGSGTLLGTSYSFVRTTTYIDIPLQLQVKPAEFLTIVVGPQFSYLLSQKDKYTFGSNSTEQEQEFENDNIRKNILGFVGGIDIMHRNFLFSARAGWDFQNNKGDGTSTTPRYKNQWLQFTIGLKI